MEEKKVDLTENYKSLWNVIAAEGMEFVGKEEFDKCLQTLTPREEYVLKCAYGLQDDGKKQTSKEIGEVFDMTSKKIEEVKERALNKLRTRTIARVKTNKKVEEHAL